MKLVCLFKLVDNKGNEVKINYSDTVVAELPQMPDEKSMLLLSHYIGNYIIAMSKEYWFKEFFGTENFIQTTYSGSAFQVIGKTLCKSCPILPESAHSPLLNERRGNNIPLQDKK